MQQSERSMAAPAPATIGESTEGPLIVHRVHTPLRALGLAWLTTLIWGSSFILIKYGLKEIQPLGFAAVRYSFGGFILLAYLPLARVSMPRLSAKIWGLFAMSGLLAYTVGQGLFYVGQDQVSALTGSFFYSLAPIFVLLLQAIHLRWRPTGLQAIGVAAVIVGALIFYPLQIAAGQWLGVILLLASNVSTGYYLLLTRYLRTTVNTSAGWLTAVALLVGGGILYLPALLLERPPHVSLEALLIIAWLAAVNTALAYTVWNYVLKVMPAFELSVMSSLIPLQTGLIGWIVLGDVLSLAQISGLLIAVAGVIVVQLRTLSGAPFRALRVDR